MEFGVKGQKSIPKHMEKGNIPEEFSVRDGTKKRTIMWLTIKVQNVDNCHHLTS